MENLFFNSLNPKPVEKIKVNISTKKIETDYEVHSTKGMRRALKGSLGESVPPSL